MGKKVEKEESRGAYKLISDNKKARFNYHIVEAFEAGLVLTGSEIKAIRRGQVNLGESFVRPDGSGSGMVVIQMNISQYSFDASKEYDPVRKRKLLLHKREIDKLRGAVEKKGLTIVPLKLYLKNGFAKLEIGLAKGKLAPDKRETTKRREADREANRAMKSSKR